MPYKDKEEQAKAQRSSYERNKAFYQERRKARRVEMQAYVDKVKSENPCVDCGDTYHPCMMQFDHIGTDKIRSVSDMMRYSVMSKMIEEIAKCELVCANCHALRTWRRQREKHGLPVG